MGNSRMENIAALGQTHTTLVDLVGHVDDAALDYRPGPEEWSTREILAHLVDDEMYVMRTRMERIIKEDKPDLAPHDEKHWHAHRNTTRDGRDMLLADFALQRAASMGIIEMLRESDWARTGYQPEYGVFTAEAWLDHWVEHDTNHIRQIEVNLAGYRGQ